MWVWRDETVRGGWRLDATGSWAWDEPGRLERVGADPRTRYDEHRHPRPRYDQPRQDERRAREEFAREQLAREQFAREQRARRERMRPAMAALPGDPFESEPIFRSVAHEVREEREERRYSEGRYRHAPQDGPARIPEPHPGSGPFPAQSRSRGLAPVETVPAPPGPDAGGGAVSPEEELRRRAERRRRPQSPREGGRHVLRH